MQQQFKVVGLAAVIVIIVFGVIVLGRDGDEQQIHNLLDQLEDYGAKEPAESKIETLGRARSIAALFTDRPELELARNIRHSGDRDELTGMLAGVRSRVSEADVSLGSRTVKIADDGRSASVILTGSATVTVNGQTERHRDKYLVELARIDGEWLIASVYPMRD